MAQVSVVRCQDYHYPRVREAVERALEPLGGMGAFVKEGQSVLIKPNLLQASSPEKGVTTHPAVVRAVVELVAGAGGRPMIGDSPAIGPFRRVLSRTGMEAMARQTGAELVDFSDVVEVKPPEGPFRRIEVARAVLEADVVINLPKLKTHSMMVMTLGVKNLFGSVPGFRKASWHLKAGTDRAMFAALLLEVCLTVGPALTVMDGVVAMEGEGPNTGDLRPLGAILASRDPLALDRTVMEALGFPPEALPVLGVARQWGLWPEVQLEGDPLRVDGFRLPKGADLTWGLPSFIKGPLRRWFLPKPQVDQKTCRVCGLCVEACPPGVMQVRGGRVEIDYGRCIRCYCCQEICPEGAIRLR